MDNLFNELPGKLESWDSRITSAKKSYKMAQTTEYRLDSEIYQENHSDNPSKDILLSLENQRSEALKEVQEAQSVLMRILMELKQCNSQIDENVRKIEQTVNGLIRIGSSSKYVRAGMSSSTVKSELQRMNSIILFYKESKDKIMELSYRCDPNAEEEEDLPKMKRL